MKPTTKKQYIVYHFHGLTILSKDIDGIAIILETMEFVNLQCQRYERSQFLNLDN